MNKYMDNKQCFLKPDPVSFCLIPKINLNAFAALASFHKIQDVLAATASSSYHVHFVRAEVITLKSPIADLLHWHRITLVMSSGA